MTSQKQPKKSPGRGPKGENRHNRGRPQTPAKLSPRCASVLGSLTPHDDTAAPMWSELECPLCGCKPAQLELHIIMDRLLHETYVK